MSRDYSGLPESLRYGVREYVENHRQPGGFLSAVICNNLWEAMGYADTANRARLYDIVSWFYREAPAPCWGSPEHMSEWLAQAREEVAS